VALQIATKLKPEYPMTLTHPQRAEMAAKSFVSQFKGRTMFAVKANPCDVLLRLLYRTGVTWFDVASIGEIRHVSRALPNAEFPEKKLCFMHPIKAPESIREAYFEHNVRVFSLDSIEELDKIVKMTKTEIGHTDLTLCVRVRTFSKHSKLDLSSKFGVYGSETKLLLQETRKWAKRLGVSFHVGSQALDPEDFRAAFQQIPAVDFDILDVSGGFPVKYPGMSPPPLPKFFTTIDRAVRDLPTAQPVEVWAEPGRALSAEYHSVIVRVERRRGSELYINDGAYGTLADAARIGWRFFVRLLRDPPSESQIMPFSFFGPTMDSWDFMPGPFHLPDDIGTGDYIEIFGVGAYGSVMRSQFNFFDTFESMVAND
jgi:ornithine decarboxylase